MRINILKQRQMEMSTMLELKCLELMDLHITGVVVDQGTITTVLIMAIVMDGVEVENLERIVHLWLARKTTFHLVVKESELMAQLNLQTQLLIPNHSLLELVLRVNLFLTKLPSKVIYKTPWKVLSKLILEIKIFKTR
jgi:hypothetical protein